MKNKNIKTVSEQITKKKTIVVTESQLERLIQKLAK